MHVDILHPDTLQPTGVVKSLAEAKQAGDWLGAINIWVARRTPRGDTLLFQRRAFHLSRAPGKIDTTIGGHFEAGETVREVLREAKEEVGRTYTLDQLSYLGKRRLIFGAEPLPQRYAIDMFMIQDDAPLSAFSPDPGELAGLYECRIDDLLSLTSGACDMIEIEGVCWQESVLQPHAFAVTFEQFLWQPGEYYRLIAQTALRFLNGERTSRLWDEGGEVG